MGAYLLESFEVLAYLLLFYLLFIIVIINIIIRTDIPPVVTESTVGTYLLESFEVIADLAVEGVGQRLRVLSVLDVLLSVEEPVGDLVLTRVRHHRDYLLHLTTNQSIDHKISKIKLKSVELNNIALPDKSSQSYTRRHLPYRITQCYLPPDARELTPPNPRQTGRYSIYLPQRDGRLS